MVVPAKSVSAPSASVAAVASNSVLVTRSEVTAGLPYTEYRPQLRYDFFHSCAYCTMTECEAQALSFSIDHYEPRQKAPELENEYSNLMYACTICNTYKSDRSPPPTARAAGYRFFRPDQDIYQQHFERDGLKLKTKTNTGFYTSQVLYLDRLALKRVRRARKKLADCDRLITEGILALRNFPLDQLPPHVKGAAARAIRQMTSFAEGFAEGIDQILREQARSPLLDKDPKALKASLERAANLKDIEGIFPGGSWRAKRRTKATPSARSRGPKKKKA